MSNVEKIEFIFTSTYKLELQEQKERNL